VINKVKARPINQAREIGRGNKVSKIKVKRIRAVNPDKETRGNKPVSRDNKVNRVKVKDSRDNKAREINPARRTSRGKVRDKAKGKGISLGSRRINRAKVISPGKAKPINRALNQASKRASRIVIPGK
jgi:hypothetical protein